MKSNMTGSSARMAPSGTRDSADLRALEESIPALIRAYVGARASVESWAGPVKVIDEVVPPRVEVGGGREPVWKTAWRAAKRSAVFVVKRGVLAPVNPLLRRWYGIALRPVTLFWIDQHVRSRARQLEVRLRHHNVILATAGDAQAATVDRLANLLQSVAMQTQRTNSWIGLASAAPIVALLLRLILTSVSGSGTGNFYDAIYRVQSFAWTMPLSAVIANPLIVRFGFRWKRAIFMGGAVENWRGISGTRRYRGMPAENIYALENRVFDDLATRRPKEPAVELFLSPFLYIAIDVTIAIAISAAGGLGGHPAPYLVTPGWFGALLGGTTLLVVWSFVLVAFRRRRRRNKLGAAL
jgi:hypothetical protein